MPRYEIGNKEAAQADLEKAVRLFLASDEKHQWPCCGAELLSMIYAEQGEWEKIVWLCDDIISNYDSGAKASRQEEEEDDDDYTFRYSYSSIEESHGPDLYVHRAIAHSHLGHNERAIECMTMAQAVALPSWKPAIFRYSGALFLHMKHFQRAGGEFQRSIDDEYTRGEYPRPEAFYLYSKALWAAENQAEAQRYHQMAIDNDESYRAKPWLGLVPFEGLDIEENLW